MDRDDWNKIWLGDHHGGPHDHDGPHHGHGEVHHYDGSPDGLLVQAVDGLTPGRALDLGCGSGDNVLWLAERGWSAVGVDFASAALDLARTQAQKRDLRAVFVEADVTEYAAEPGLDLITLFYLHLPEESRRRVLAQATQWLAPGGLLLFAGHDRSDPQWHDHIPAAQLSTPEDVVPSLEGLTIDRAEVVMHTAHRHEPAGTTVVVGRRNSA